MRISYIWRDPWRITYPRERPVLRISLNSSICRSDEFFFTSFFFFFLFILTAAVSCISQECLHKELFCHWPTVLTWRVTAISVINPTFHKTQNQDPPTWQVTDSNLAGSYITRWLLSPRGNYHHSAKQEDLQQSWQIKGPIKTVCCMSNWYSKRLRLLWKSMQWGRWEDPPYVIPTDIIENWSSLVH